MTKLKWAQLYYYKLGVDDSDPDAIVCVKRDDKGFDEYKFYKGQFIDDWPNDITFFMEGRNQEDYLVGGLHWRAISDRVRLVLEKNKIKGIQVLPIQVLSSETGKDIGIYWVFNVMEIVDALNITQTRWLNSTTKDKDEYPTLNVLKEVFRKEVVIDFDIFHLSIGKEIKAAIYISERLKNLLEREQVTRGFRFFPIPVV